MAFETDIDALEQLRRFMDFLPASNLEYPVIPTDDPPNRQEPSLDSLVPENPNEPYDVKELIVKLVDESDFFEIQPDYAKNIIIGYGRMEGSA